MKMATYTIKNNKLGFLRNNNKIVKRDRKIREIKIKGLHIFFIILLFSVIASGIYYFGKFIMTWEKLNVDTYILENSENIDQKEIKEIIVKYKGNILGLNLTKMKSELLKIIKVKDVRIKRILPSGIKISFVKRKPVLQFEYKGKWSIIDEEGIILESVKGIDNNLPVVKGVSKRSIKNLIPYLDELNSVKKIVEYISIRKPFGILLKLKEGNITVYPGEKNFKKKIGYFFKLKEEKVLKYLRIKSIDMRFDDRIYLEYDKKDLFSG